MESWGHKRKSPTLASMGLVINAHCLDKSSNKCIIRIELPPLAIVVSTIDKGGSAASMIHFFELLLTQYANCLFRNYEFCALLQNFSVNNLHVTRNCANLTSADGLK